MSEFSVSHVIVTGLHGQFDVELQFNPGLNIIYGKNGRGKTTVLHILANVMERDFSRFFHLQFSSIFIAFHSGNVIQLYPGPDAPGRSLHLLLNGEFVGEYSGAADNIDPDVKSRLDEVLGPRPVYLPAFRSILERTTNPYRYNTPGEAKSAYDAIVKRESEISGRRDDLPHATAAKTLQCRQWFGEFVPVIRYPSLIDVDQRLSNECRRAKLQMASIEQSVFSESFARVFDALAPSWDAPKRSTPDLLRDVAASVGKIRSKADGQDEDIYGHILTAVRRLYQEGDASAETTNRVLALYAELLKRRSDAQEKLFYRIEDFEISVNKFLDGKELSVADVQKAGRHLGPVVRLSTGRKLGLTSLSSGERQVLTMIFCASRMSQGQGIFLVDEPELSLHVDWQRDILMEVARQAGGRQIIACTHSPEVGADNPECIQFFEPKWAESYLFGEDFWADEDLPEDVL
jgi:predicted ATPase